MYCQHTGLPSNVSQLTVDLPQCKQIDLIDLCHDQELNEFYEQSEFGDTTPPPSHNYIILTLLSFLIIINFVIFVLQCYIFRYSHRNYEQLSDLRENEDVEEELILSEPEPESISRFQPNCDDKIFSELEYELCQLWNMYTNSQKKIFDKMQMARCLKLLFEKLPEPTEHPDYFRSEYSYNGRISCFNPPDRYLLLDAKRRGYLEADYFYNPYVIVDHVRTTSTAEAYGYRFDVRVTQTRLGVTQVHNWDFGSRSESPANFCGRRADQSRDEVDAVVDEQSDYDQPQPGIHPVSPMPDYVKVGELV